VQANLVVLTEDVAGEFKRFCVLNTGPCPILEVTEPGVYEPRCARGADLRTDLPRYRVYLRGGLAEQPLDIVRYWDTHGAVGENIATSPHRHITPWVAFLLGCSFTFESALLRAGIPVRHIEQRRNVPMYRTNIQCKPAGIFSGPMVVSMRPMTLAQARHAREITALMPGSHGAPVQIGDPAVIGIQNIDSPDYGDPVEIRSDEVPVFWACGVTPLEAILRAKPELAIVHEPGHMFITDLPAPLP
jgi:uncharacterized protein YcsI (UPF0317 family)